MDDTVLGTSRRTWLERPPDEVLATRLERDAFDADLVMDDRVRSVHFPASWPGDALPLVSNWLELRRSDRRGEPWGGTVVERAPQRAIGTIGCKAWPDGTGSVEVGYGVERARRGRGFARRRSRRSSTYSHATTPSVAWWQRVVPRVASRRGVGEERVP